MTLADRVLVVENEATVREVAVTSLEQAGFEVAVAANADLGWRAILEQRPDALILDLLLPGRPGLDLLRAVRSDPATRAVPVLVLSARDTEMDKLLCFEHGADDFLARPFSPRELVARIRVMVRRSRPISEDDAIVVGMLRVYPLAREATFHGRRMNLTPREFELLQYLARNPGRVMTRADLLRNVWGHSFSGDSRTVDVHVRRLRHKIGDLHPVIETVTGSGYKLMKAGPVGA